MKYYTQIIATAVHAAVQLAMFCTACINQLHAYEMFCMIRNILLFNLKSLAFSLASARKHELSVDLTHD